MKNDELATLYELVIDLNDRLDLPALLQGVMAHVLALSSAGDAALYLYDSLSGDFELAAQTGDASPSGDRLRRGQGIAERVIGTRSPFAVDPSLPANDLPGVDPLATGAALYLPLLHRDELLGVVSIIHLPGSLRHYDENEVNRLTQLATLAAGAIKHALLCSDATRSAEINEIVASIATRFVRITPDRVDSEINDMLRRIGEFAQMDRCCLFQFSGHSEFVSNTHEWCAADIEPNIYGLQALPAAAQPWLMSRCRAGHATYIRCLDDLPDQAEAEKKLLAALGSRSAAIIPLLLDSEPLGFLSFDTIRREHLWRKHDIKLLKLVAEVFALALNQTHAERDLRNLNQELEARVADRTVELQASEEQLRFVVEHSLQGILLYQDGRVQFANQALAAIAGCTVEDLLAAETTDLIGRIHPDDCELVYKRLPLPEQSASGQATLQFRILWPDGSVRWVICMAVRAMYRGRPATQAVAVDITDFKHAEQALVESTQFVERITETGPMMVFVHDLVAHTDIYINRAACEFHGYSPADIAAMGNNLLPSIVHPDDLPLVTANYSRYAQLADGEIVQQEARIRRKDGAWRWMLARYSVFQRDANGRALQLIGIGMDITDRKQSERAMQEAETALRAALAKEQELGELKSRFLAMASHEFRTPLSVILSIAETLLHYRSRLGEEKVNDRLARVCVQVEHLSELIEEILSLTGAQAGKVKVKLQPLDFDAFCRQIVDEYASRPDITHELVYTSSAQSPAVLADSHLLRTVVTNLLSNAIKYSAASSCVRVATGCRNDTVWLAVADAGIGIPDSDQERMFEAFHRASNVGQQVGTGLGLSITKEFLLLMGGSIHFESKLGVGSTFEVLLPLLAWGGA